MDLSPVPFTNMASCSALYSIFHSANSVIMMCGKKLWRLVLVKCIQRRYTQLHIYGSTAEPVSLFPLSVHLHAMLLCLMSEKDWVWGELLGVFGVGMLLFCHDARYFSHQLEGHPNSCFVGHILVACAGQCGTFLCNNIHSLVCIILYLVSIIEFILYNRIH